MTKLEKYNSYKNSGVEWLGDIPEHWEVQKLKFNAKIETGNSISDSKKGNYENIEIESYPYISTKDINYEFSTIDYDNGLKIPTTNKDFKIASPETTLICIEGGSAGKKIAYNTQSICYVNKLASLQSINNNPKYIYYLTKSNPFKIQFELSMNGLIGGVSISIMKNFELLFPPLQEQEKIANYLDKKTAQIDEAISQKQKLIELLKERKQIVINDAVTSGLDKNVELKNSGIEWIGQIPKHWEVKKLKFIIKNKLKYGANESGIEYNEKLPRYIRITDFSDSGKLSEKNKLSLSWEQGKDFLLKDGDILFARSGATVGKTYQFKKSMSIEENYAFAGYLIKAEPDENIIMSDYLYIYTNSDLFNSWKESIFNKATIENIGADKYSELYFTIPPLEEQKVILKEYFTISLKIDKAIELEQNYIEKLKEYKVTLIDSVVTGKVRVC